MPALHKSAKHIQIAFPQRVAAGSVSPGSAQATPAAFRRKDIALGPAGEAVAEVCAAVGPHPTNIIATVMQTANIMTVFRMNHEHSPLALLLNGQSPHHTYNDRIERFVSPRRAKARKAAFYAAK
jgi:hypothetical protein